MSQMSDSDVNNLKAGIEDSPPATATTAEPSVDVASAAMKFAADIRLKIFSILSVYPRLNPSHMQVSLGPSLSPKLWHPVLDQMILEGEVEKLQVRPSIAPPSGRDNVHTIIQLVQKPSPAQ